MNNGVVSLAHVNPFLDEMDHDHMHHTGFSTDMNLQAMFGDVKFVLMGGMPKRMRDCAHYLQKELDIQFPTGVQLHDLCEKFGRYTMYKVGPVICVSHGMGQASISILLHEMIKLMHYSKAIDPIFVRIGTSGGIGLKPGTVVITEKAKDGLMNTFHSAIICGKVVQRPSVLPLKLAQDIANCIQESDHFNVVIGNTMCVDDFYEGQGRQDGAFCSFTELDKVNYFHKLVENGIKNIEMEATVFAAMCNHANIKGAILCVTLVDRLKDDQVLVTQEELMEFQHRPQVLIGRYIKKNF